jgi:acetolactate synthase-1/2/3 large subunit
MKMTGAEIVVRALEDEAVRWTFGIPGTHNIELYDQLARSSQIQPILVTDEQSASFMADGVSRSASNRGHLGCVNVVPGAGLTHALSGIAEAYMDTTPLLVLGCGVRTDLDKGYQLHDIDQLAVVRPITKGQFRPAEGSEIYEVVRKACRLARTPPQGPVYVEIPANLYLFRHETELEVTEDTLPAKPSPSSEDIDAICELLSRSRRPLLYLGLGAASAGRDLITLAERLEAPVSTSFQGKGVFPENHPLWLWCAFGDSAPPFARKIAASCDATLAIGCRFSEVGTASYGLEPPQPMVHVDIEGAVLNRNYPAKIAIEADSGELVRALLENLTAKEKDAQLRDTIKSGHEKVRKVWSEEEKSDNGVSPPRLLSTLQEVFGKDAVFTTDSGNGTFLAVECLRLDRPQSFLAPIDYSCMGYAVPGAVGAALACPDRPVVALAGDGAFLMTGLELLTASHLELPVTVIVLRDGQLAQIAQFQKTVFGKTTASELPDYDLSAICRGVGVEHLDLSRDEDVEEVLRKAKGVRDKGQPIVVEVAIDYSTKTYFTRGTVRTNFKRLPWSARLRFLGRVLRRKLPGG